MLFGAIHIVYCNICVTFVVVYLVTDFFLPVYVDMNLL